jgi:hypothetical protein
LIKNPQESKEGSKIQRNLVKMSSTCTQMEMQEALWTMASTPLPWTQEEEQILTPADSIGMEKICLFPKTICLTSKKMPKTSYE